ncbi:hypothetical protein [Galbibacter orientalis]|uniref:Uncharacterized protein n=1 Tax=Galbibacter orientalis DSM 19592 TaxID=926559 RepID=I3C6Q4_9FLAO|nr:hypothetical protein [Galbibacter orientalis]EIJ39297.1 hypothetical protein JoomaDRAFT_2309 [Galbibacter orientalis DSM 19592]
MRNTKPTLLLVEDLIEPIENSIKELELIYKDNLKKKSDYILKGTFVYVISLFESSFTECLKRFLISFPDKISDGKISGKESKYLLETVFASDAIEFIIDDFLYEYTYKDVSEIMKRTFSLLDIDSKKISFNNDNLIERKERRNILVHNDLKVDKKYIRNTKCDPQILRKKLNIDEKYIIDTITLTESILEQTKSELILKYGDYTRNKLLRNAWNYVFNSPLLNYDDYWNENHGFIFENNKKIDISNLSSGEKTWLAYWIQHYSSSILDKYFKFSDMHMSSYQSKKMNFLIEFFNKYPLILQHS